MVVKKRGDKPLGKGALKRTGLRREGSPKWTKKSSVKSAGKAAGLGGGKKVQKQRKPKKKLEDKTASELVEVADKEFSRYVRLRDSVRQSDGSWVTKCIDCDRTKAVYADGKWIKGFDNGHYITRGVHSLRYDEMNCNAQSSHCNAWRDKGDVYKDYTRALDKKYGKGVANELSELSKLPNSRKMLTKDELLDIIYTCRNYVKKALDN